MKWVTRIIIITFASIGIAISLYLLPQLDTNSTMNQQDMTVFHSSKLRQISSDNLVDYLLEIPLRSQLSRVDWSHSILTIDLKIAEGNNSPNEIFEDLYRLTYFGFVGTTNVKQVLVRVLAENEPSNKNGELLLTMDARRENMSLEGLEKLKHNETNLEQFLNANFKLTYMKHWTDLGKKGSGEGSQT